MRPFFELTKPTKPLKKNLTEPTKLFFLKLRNYVGPNRWFRKPKKNVETFFRRFHETLFRDFDGFAKHHPSTMKFRETIDGFTKPSQN